MEPVGEVGGFYLEGQGDLVSRTRKLQYHLSYSLNSLKGAYIKDYIGDYCRGY